MTLPTTLTIDIEPTNRCNAECYFCPRDQTPHQGLMSPETFSAALARAVELRERLGSDSGHDLQVNLCGLGEPLLNRHTPDFVRQIKQAGFVCNMASNASLLDERRAEALLEAGLDEIDVNVGELGADYDDIYKVSWEKTYENLMRFADLSAGACAVRIILVDHREDPEHLATVEAFWRDAGFDSFHTFPLINRGGSLHRDDYDFSKRSDLDAARELLDAAGGEAICSLPFVSMIVGYDGIYYLCCSDWKKELDLGSVHDVSLIDVLRRKLEFTLNRDSLCDQCSLDPLNRIASTIEASKSGRNVGLQWVVRETATDGAALRRLLGGLDSQLLSVQARPQPSGRRLIPVRVT